MQSFVSVAELNYPAKKWINSNLLIKNLTHKTEVIVNTPITLVIKRDSWCKTMIKLSNPALHEEPRHQSGAIIPLKQEESLLDWLQSTGRLVSYQPIDYYYEDEVDEEEDVEEFVDAYSFDAEEVEDLEE